MINSISKISGIFLLFALFLITSCASRKEVVYFQDAGDYETLVDKEVPVTKFKVDDLVSIYVSSGNPEASAPFNLYRGLSAGNAGGGTSSGPQVAYLIDEDGMIDFPVIGKIKIVGLSPDELRVLLQKKLADFLKDPIINISLENFTVTVLGEVARPGTYPIPGGQQVTILEALGLAGDMTLRGMRENVLVIRDFDGTKVYQRINLTSKDLFDSPVFYLTQNDVVYVEPNKTAIRETTIGRNTTLTIQIISLLITTTAIILTRA